MFIGLRKSPSYGWRFSCIQKKKNSTISHKITRRNMKKNILPIYYYINMYWLVLSLGRRNRLKTHLKVHHTELGHVSEDVPSCLFLSSSSRLRQIYTGVIMKARRRSSTPPPPSVRIARFIDLVLPPSDSSPGLLYADLRMRVHTHCHIHTYTHAYTYTHIHTHTHAHAYTHIHILKYTYTHAHSHIHTHTYICICIHKHVVHIPTRLGKFGNGRRVSKSFTTPWTPKYAGRGQQVFARANVLITLITPQWHPKCTRGLGKYIYIYI